MIDCIILDDEPLAIKLLESYVSKLDNLNLKASFSNPIEALSFLQKDKVNLIFLDIQMPELNGMQFAKVIGGQAKIIFTTAYPDYAVEGFELKATDYLVKPISFHRFVDAVTRVTDNFTTKENTVPAPEYIFVKTDYRLQKINLKDISFFKGMGDYCSIHLTEGKILTLQKMKSFEESLPKSQFIRVHKSYIIAINKIEFVEKNRIKIQNELIPIGATYLDSINKILRS